MIKHYKNSPTHYLAHLFGHEGENSILSLLIKEGLALELSAGGSTELDLFTNFMVSVSLTKKGNYLINFYSFLQGFWILNINY